MSEPGSGISEGARYRWLEDERRDATALRARVHELVHRDVAVVPVIRLADVERRLRVVLEDALPSSLWPPHPATDATSAHTTRLRIRSTVAPEPARRQGS